MPKRTRIATRPGRERDTNQAAFDAAQHVIALTEGQPTKHQAAVTLGRLGGLKGGRARANKLTEQQRSDIASRAGKARWEKERKLG